MFLTASNLAFHLISRGVVTSASVVEGNFTLIEVGRRNRNFKIIRQELPGLFVKQVKDTDQLSTSTLQREATFYKRVNQNPQFAPLKELVPDFVDYDPSRYALVIDLLPEAESVAEYQKRTDSLPLNVVADVGRALGLCHSQLPALLNDPVVPKELHAEIPWVMSLEQNGYVILEHFGIVGKQLAEIIRQYPNLQPMLSQLRNEWQYDSLIHGDPKMENWMVQSPETEKVDLKLVDWELVDVGDGAWDVAMVFKEFLVLWLLSQPDTSNPIPHGLALPTPRQLTDLHPLIREFWEAYVAARKFTPEEADAYLKRCVRFTAARLIVAVLEYFFHLGQLNNHASAMIVLSAAILQQPESAAADLLGLGKR